MFIISSHSSLSVAAALGVALAIAAFWHQNSETVVIQGFPSPQDWTALNNTVGGRLALGIPWSMPCFSWYNGSSVQPQPAECKYVQENYYDSHCVSRYSFPATPTYFV